MKLSDSKSRIIGIQVGEIELNFIRPDKPPIKAKFALVGDGGICGYFDKSEDWSEKSLEALRVFAEALEMDVLGRIFQVTGDATTDEKSNEPAQF